MLLSCILKLEAANDGKIPMTHGHLVQAAFLKLIEKNLSEKDQFYVWELHRQKRYNPFTVSHLFGKREFKNNCLIVKEDDLLDLRLTGFDKTLSECLLSMKDKINLMNIGNVTFGIDEIITNNTEHNRANQTTYQELVKKWSEYSEELPRKFSFNFMSTTTFRDGEQNLLFPLPHLVFYSLAEKWKRYAPEPFGKEIQGFQDQLLDWKQKMTGNEDKTGFWELLDKIINVSKYDLKTKMLHFPKYKRIGFTGFADYEIPQNTTIPANWLRLLNLLADFSFYAGIGYQTTRGMGQVKLLNSIKTAEEVKEENK